MPVKHRIEAVSHAQADDMESWSNLSGDVLLLRRVDSDGWVAFLDFLPVTDAERDNGPLAFETDGRDDAVMTAPDAKALATKLARQEHLHVAFDGYPAEPDEVPAEEHVIE